MTFLELQQQVESNIGRTDKLDEIKKALNWALKHITRQHTFKSLDTAAFTNTTPDVSVYTLPPDLRVLLSVRCDGKLLAELHPIELEHLIRTTKVQVKSQPTVFAQTSGNPSDSLVVTTSLTAMRLFPIPSGSYQLEIYYSRWPMPLTADGDAVEIPDVEDAVLALATWKVYVGMQMVEEAQLWWGLYRNTIDAIVHTDSRRASWTPGAAKLQRSFGSGGDPALDPFVRKEV